MNLILLNDLIKQALQEDIGHGDITTNAIIPAEHRSYGEIILKENGVIAGLPVVSQVFYQVDPALRFYTLAEEGAQMDEGTVVARVEGSTRSILMGERVALNYLQRMSGIASVTRKAVEAVKPYEIKIADTRKTTPGLRMIEKYAVRVGGGINHRFGLDDAILIKDNHIAAAGGITNAVRMAREYTGHMVKIEVETETLEQVKEAAESAVDVILLDNMTVEQMKEAVTLIPDEITVEASGGFHLDNLKEAASIGIDVISIGWLTHSSTALDISLNIKGVIKN